jgi:hypothetical protein
MESFEAFFKFLNSYPVWAKGCVLASIVFALLVLVFAPRDEASESSNSTQADIQKHPPSSQEDQPIFLTIRSIRLFPDDSNSEVQVLAIVNGTTFVHPSVGGVKWMKVGPDMSVKRIELPHSNRYDIRFEMRFRGGSSLAGNHVNHVEASRISEAGSQAITTVWKLP